MNSLEPTELTCVLLMYLVTLFLMLPAHSIPEL
jgi:hypothetical protein